jgi:hypothetical protein
VYVNEIGKRNKTKHQMCSLYKNHLQWIKFEGPKVIASHQTGESKIQKGFYRKRLLSNGRLETKCSTDKSAKNVELIIEGHKQTIIHFEASWLPSGAH